MDVLLDTCGRRTATCVLLLHMFVMKAAADCLKPQLQPGIVLANDALLLNDFPNGLEVTVECGNGFVKHNGSGIMTCFNDVWTEPILNCKKKDCGPPKPQANMSFNTSGGTTYGDIIKVICDKGFMISGSGYKQCYSSGWSGRAKCEIVTCSTPDNVTNGRSSWHSQDEPKYGNIIQYFCNEGYTLIGNDSLLCNEHGLYDSQPPECKGVTKEDTTKMATPTPPTKEASTPTEAPAIPTDSTVTTSATPTVSPSLPGGRGISTTEGRATTTSVTSFQDEHDETVDTNKDIGYMPVIVSVICLSLVLCIVALVLHKFLLRRKGSVNGTAPIYERASVTQEGRAKATEVPL